MSPVGNRLGLKAPIIFVGLPLVISKILAEYKGQNDREGTATRSFYFGAPKDAALFWLFLAEPQRHFGQQKGIVFVTRKYNYKIEYLLGNCEKRSD